MAETLVENRICGACGAEVRAGALFCYNCGGSLAPDFLKSEKQTEIKKPVDAPFSNDLTNNNDNSAARLEKMVVEQAADQPIEKPARQNEAKLKSAANLRRQSKTFERKRVEVVWVEPENAPNGWFIVVALLLTLFVVGIFFLAMYLK
jgi:hypothetical protein